MKNQLLISLIILAYVIWPTTSLVFEDLPSVQALLAGVSEDYKGKTLESIYADISIKKLQRLDESTGNFSER